MERGGEKINLQDEQEKRKTMLKIAFIGRCKPYNSG
jgi:hypothetical protein